MNRAYRINALIAGRFGIVAIIMTAWFILAVWYLIPRGLVTPNGHLIDPSTTDPGGYSVWSYKHLAYSDIYRLYAERGLWSHPFPYVQARIEYPVLTGLFMWLAGFAPGANGNFIASAVGLWLAGLLSLFALRKIVPQVYWLFAFTPLLLVLALLNWDLLGIAFLVVGLWLLKDERWIYSGVAFGLGTCTKLFPIVYVPFIVARLARERDWTNAQLFLTAFLTTCIVVNVPFAIAGYHNWTFFLSFNASRSGTGLIDVLGSDVAAHDALIAIALAATIVVGIWTVLRGGSAERAAALTFVVFLLLNKVYSPQYTLWLVVMALIAEWPVWSILLLSCTGLAYYYGTFATLYITNASVAHTVVTTWWQDVIAPWINRVQVIGIGASALGAVLLGPTRSIDPMSTDEPAGPLNGGRTDPRSTARIHAAVDSID